MRRLLDPSDPFSYLRVTVAGLLLAGTLLAIVLALSGIAPRALLLVGVFWALYGLILGLLDGVLVPAVEMLTRMVQNVGLGGGSGYSEIETLVTRGLLADAAKAYAERAASGDPEALLRRAALLAGPLNNPELAATELEAQRRRAHPLARAEDFQFGMALADLYEHRLDQPGKAMAELRRLLDRYPSSRRTRQLRTTLAALKQESLGTPR